MESKQEQPDDSQEADPVEDEQRPKGRPLGKSYGSVKSIRFTPADAYLLRALAEAWGCSEAAVMRRLLRDGAKKAGIRSIPRRMDERGAA